MSCEQKQQAFATAMQNVQETIERELAEIAAAAEKKATEVSNEFEQGNDLAEGVGAATGTVVGGVLGGVGGGVIGGTVGKTIGSLFVLEISNQEEIISMDIPQVTVANQDWMFDLPAVVMKNNDIIFNIPTLVMKRVEGPPIPHTTVRMRTKCIGGGLLPKICTDVPETTVTWEKTYLDVPTYESREQRIVIGVPEVEMREQKIVVGVPQVSMKRQEVKFKIPVITLRFVKDAGKRAAKAAEKIALEAATASTQKRLAMKERIRTEVVLPATQMFECYKNDIQTKRQSVTAMYEPEILKLTDAVKNLIANGVPQEDDDYIKQKEQLDKVIAQRDVATSSFDKALLQLDEETKKAIQKLLDFED